MAPSEASSPGGGGSGGFGWPGRFSDGRTAVLHRVRARIVDDTLAIGDDSGTSLAAWPLGEVRLIDEGDGDRTIRLARLGGEARLTLGDTQARSLLELHCPQLHAGMGGESSWRVIAAWCAAAVAATAFLIFAIIPFLADHAERFVSPSLEAKLGDQVADIIVALTVAAADKDHAECTAPAGRAALDTITAPLFAQATLSNPVRVRVINSALINALALPGGQILVFRGLIDFAQSPNEVAGVIAHELGHQVLDHPTRLVIRQTGTGFVIGLVLGDVFGGSALAIASTAILDTGFNRDAESAADAEGVIFMTKAGFDLRPLAAFFERLDHDKQNGDIPIPFLRTHPPNDTRAKLIEQAAQGGKPALDAAQWQDLKAICR